MKNGKRVRKGMTKRASLLQESLSYKTARVQPPTKRIGIDHDVTDPVFNIKLSDFEENRCLNLEKTLVAKLVP